MKKQKYNFEESKRPSPRLNKVVFNENFTENLNLIPSGLIRKLRNKKKELLLTIDRIPFVEQHIKLTEKKLDFIKNMQDISKIDLTTLEVLEVFKSWKKRLMTILMIIF